MNDRYVSGGHLVVDSCKAAEHVGRVGIELCDACSLPGTELELLRKIFALESVCQMTLE